ncbi:MAG: hypothetical protein JWP87_483 [Labilithrix sp.]|jgi:hypothetical protein|nr:hypothetical protein [Labilithrix sp.]
MNLTTTFLITSLVLAGCAAPTEETVDGSESALSSSPWEAAVTCGGHGLTVDVDRNERRHLQAVIRDPGAVAYLGSHPGAGASGKPNAHGEIVIEGFVTRGVFSAADFGGFRHSAFSVADALLPEAYVNREGDGVRVRLVTWASGHEVETSNWFFPHCR